MVSPSNRAYFELRCAFLNKVVIYLDYNATTPLDDGVLAAMMPFLQENWGNASSPHQVGRRARARLDDARERICGVLGCKPSELVFTSGGTEANNHAILGTARKLRDRGKHIITSQVEHHAVLHCCDYLEKHEGCSVTRLPVDGKGRVDPIQVGKAIRPDTVLVTIMAANNEIGTMQPVVEIGEICRKKGVLFHTDAAQAFGKVPFSHIQQFGADMVSLCAHKFHGPKGAGALYVRSPFQPHSLLHGGAHENERRAGTENIAAIAGLAHAVESFVREPVFAEAALRPLMHKLGKLCEAPYVRRVGPEVGLCNTFAVVVEDADSIALVANLDLEGICASNGSACSAGALEPSHVIVAIGLPDLADSLVRFSIGRGTTNAEIDKLLKVWPDAVSLSRLQ